MDDFMVLPYSHPDLYSPPQIEEMRKAGTLAPEVDEDGNMINPHIPQYMSQVIQIPTTDHTSQSLDAPNPHLEA